MQVVTFRCNPGRPAPPSHPQPPQEISMSTDHAACATARISITVTDFHEIDRGPSQADIELTDTGHGTVSQGRINDPIVVTAEAYLEFSVSAREGDRYTYSPVGI